MDKGIVRRLHANSDDNGDDIGITAISDFHVQQNVATVSIDHGAVVAVCQQFDKHAINCHAAVGGSCCDDVAL